MGVRAGAVTLEFRRAVLVRERICRALPVSISGSGHAQIVRGVCRRTSEMHRTQDSYVSVSCNCRAECSLEASAFAWGVGDLGGRSAAF